MIIGTLFVIITIFMLTALSQRLTVRHYTEYSDKVTSAVRLAVLTDLHGTEYGDRQEELLLAVDAKKPDLVLLVGDFEDNVKIHEETRELLSVLGKKYPCYYVTGNHEYWTGAVEEKKELVRSYGIKVLEGQAENLELGGQTIAVCGVDDPAVGSRNWSRQLQSARNGSAAGSYSILLSHRPEKVKEYEAYGFDLVLCGHAHGGQVRLPFVMNGLYAPHQGLFPKYAGGRYQLSDTVMIVSRGLAVNWLLRVFNPPELVIVDVKPAAGSNSNSPT